MQVVLIRHAHSEANAKGILSGRISGVHLSATGKCQAQELSPRLGSIKVAQLRISPLERCAETISPWWENVGKKCNPNVEILQDRDLIEVDYGQWSGKKLALLSKNKLWRTVQNNPSGMYFPSGEGLAQMQERAMRSVHAAIESTRRGATVLVSHADVIKSIVASALGLHLDGFQRIVIDPASVSVIDFSGDNPRIILLNDSGADLASFINAPSRKRNFLGGGVGK